MTQCMQLVGKTAATVNCDQGELEELFKGRNLAGCSFVQSFHHKFARSVGGFCNWFWQSTIGHELHIEEQR